MPHSRVPIRDLSRIHAFTALIGTTVITITFFIGTDHVITVSAIIITASAVMSVVDDVNAFIAAVCK